MVRTINLVEASHSQCGHGITHVSENVFKTIGTGVARRSFPHRIEVWDNTARPSSDPQAAYVSPQGHGTDELVSVQLRPMAVILDARADLPQATHDDTALAMGEQVCLRYPDGSLSACYVVRPVAWVLAA